MSSEPDSLPQIASGQTLCAVSVTEPNTGSDVASVALKATKVDGGWRLNGGKTWCTYAGAAGATAGSGQNQPRRQTRAQGPFVIRRRKTHLRRP